LAILKNFFAQFWDAQAFYIISGMFIFILYRYIDEKSHRVLGVWDRMIQLLRKWEEKYKELKDLGSLAWLAWWIQGHPFFKEKDKSFLKKKIEGILEKGKASELKDFYQALVDQTKNLFRMFAYQGFIALCRELVAYYQYLERVENSSYLHKDICPRIVFSSSGRHKVFAQIEPELPRALNSYEKNIVGRIALKQKFLINDLANVFFMRSRYIFAPLWMDEESMAYFIETLEKIFKEDKILVQKRQKTPFSRRSFSLMKETGLLEFYAGIFEEAKKNKLNIEETASYIAHHMYYDARILPFRIEELRWLVRHNPSKKHFQILLLDFQFLQMVPAIVLAADKLEKEFQKKGISFSIVGMDYDPSMVLRAKETLRKLGMQDRVRLLAPDDNVLLKYQREEKDIPEGDLTRLLDYHAEFVENKMDLILFMDPPGSLVPSKESREIISVFRNLEKILAPHGLMALFVRDKKLKQSLVFDDLTKDAWVLRTDAWMRTEHHSTPGILEDVLYKKILFNVRSLKKLNDRFHWLFRETGKLKHSSYHQWQRLKYLENRKRVFQLDKNTINVEIAISDFDGDWNYWTPLIIKEYDAILEKFPERVVFFSVFLVGDFLPDFNGISMPANYDSKDILEKILSYDLIHGKPAQRDLLEKRNIRIIPILGNNEFIFLSAVEADDRCLKIMYEDRFRVWLNQFKITSDTFDNWKKSFLKNRKIRHLYDAIRFRSHLLLEGHFGAFYTAGGNNLIASVHDLDERFFEQTRLMTEKLREKTVEASRKNTYFYQVTKDPLLRRILYFEQSSSDIDPEILKTFSTIIGHPFLWLVNNSIPSVLIGQETRFHVIGSAGSMVVISQNGVKRFIKNKDITQELYSKEDFFRKFNEALDNLIKKETEKIVLDEVVLKMRSKVEMILADFMRWIRDNRGVVHKYLSSIVHVFLTDIDILHIQQVMVSPIGLSQSLKRKDADISWNEMEKPQETIVEQEPIFVDESFTDWNRQEKELVIKLRLLNTRGFHTRPAAMVFNLIRRPYFNGVTVFALREDFPEWKEVMLPLDLAFFALEKGKSVIFRLKAGWAETRSIYVLASALIYLFEKAKFFEEDNFDPTGNIFVQYVQKIQSVLPMNEIENIEKHKTKSMVLPSMFLSVFVFLFVLGLSYLFNLFHILEVSSGLGQGLGLFGVEKWVSLGFLLGITSNYTAAEQKAMEDCPGCVVQDDGTRVCIFDIPEDERPDDWEEREKKCKRRKRARRFAPRPPRPFRGFILLRPYPIIPFPRKRPGMDENDEGDNNRFPFLNKIMIPPSRFARNPFAFWFIRYGFGFPGQDKGGYSGPEGNTPQKGFPQTPYQRWPTDFSTGRGPGSGTGPGDDDRGKRAFFIPPPFQETLPVVPIKEKEHHPWSPIFVKITPWRPWRLIIPKILLAPPFSSGGQRIDYIFGKAEIDKPLKDDTSAIFELLKKYMRRREEYLWKHVFNEIQQSEKRKKESRRKRQERELSNDIFNEQRNHQDKQLSPYGFYMSRNPRETIDDGKQQKEQWLKNALEKIKGEERFQLMQDVWSGKYTRELSQGLLFFELKSDGDIVKVPHDVEHFRALLAARYGMPPEIPLKKWPKIFDRKKPEDKKYIIRRPTINPKKMFCLALNIKGRIYRPITTDWVHEVLCVVDRFKKQPVIRNPILPMAKVFYPTPLISYSPDRAYAYVRLNVLGDFTPVIFNDDLPRIVLFTDRYRQIFV